MTHAPKPVVVFVPVAIGDRRCWRRSKPEDRRAHKAVRPEHWPVRQGIPSQLGRDELRRRVQEFRDANRSRVEEMLTEARLKLAA
jgi:hypothetical protein